MASSLCRYLEKNEEDNRDVDMISYQIILESSATDSEFSDTESIESVQANTTVSAKDSSDISSDNISEYYMSEYDIVSSPDTIEPSVFEKDIFSSYSSSARDIPIDSAQPTEDDDLTDVSEYDSDNLRPLPYHRFYHTCAQCFSPNTNPAFRFCESCYQVRKEFYAPKPFRRNKRKKTDIVAPPSKKMKTSSSNDFDNALCAPSSSEASSVSTMPNSDTVSNSQDSGFESLALSCDWPPEKEKCLTCLTTSLNGLFIHGKTAHRCCCYRCSKQIWHKTRRCPICRRKIDKVCALLG